MVLTQKNKIADEYSDSVSTDSTTGCLSYCSMRLYLPMYHHRLWGHSLETTDKELDECSIAPAISMVFNFNFNFNCSIAPTLPSNTTPPQKSAEITDCMVVGVQWGSHLCSIVAWTRAAQYIQYEKFQKNSGSDTRIQNFGSIGSIGSVESIENIESIESFERIVSIVNIVSIESVESMTVLLEFGYLQCKSSRSCRI